MKFFFKPLLWILAMTVFSCQKAGDLGDELQENGRQIETAYTDTITVNAQIIKMDSVSTLNSSYMLVGSCYDEVLKGNYYAEAYSRMYILERDTFDISKVSYLGKTYKTYYDSLSLDLRYDKHYGDTTVEQIFDAYSLDAEVQDSTPYFNNSVIKTKTLLGSAKYAGKNEKGNYLHFKLNDALGNEFFSKSGSTEFLNEKNFNAYFKGISVKPREKNKNAAVLALDLVDEAEGKAGILLHYHYLRPKDNGVGDTIIRLTYGIGFGWRFNYFESDFSQNPALASIKEGIDLNSSLNNNLCVIQPCSGLAVRLEFPYIKQFFEKYNKEMLFQRVSLVISPAENTVNEFWLPPSNVTLMFALPDGTPQRNGSIDVTLPKEGASSGNASMYFLANGYSYTDVKITSYMQAIADGTLKNNGLILKGSEQESSVSRLIFGNAKSLSFPLKMHVYYTYRK
jgi:hypothetical protein